MEKIRKASRKLAMQGRGVEEGRGGVGWGGVQSEDSWEIRLVIGNGVR